jgi:hypothetical protein
MIMGLLSREQHLFHDHAVRPRLGAHHWMRTTTHL